MGIVQTLTDFGTLSFLTGMLSQTLSLKTRRSIEKRRKNKSQSGNWLRKTGSLDTNQAANTQELRVCDAHCQENEVQNPRKEKVQWQRGPLLTKEFFVTDTHQQRDHQFPLRVLHSRASLILESTLTSTKWTPSFPVCFYYCGLLTFGF